MINIFKIVIQYNNVKELRSMKYKKCFRKKKCKKTKLYLFKDIKVTNMYINVMENKIDTQNM